MQDRADNPFITFSELYPDAPVPRRADPAPFGGVYLRAQRYCEPFTMASTYGWYVFPPMNFSLLWDGDQCFWKRPEEHEWHQFHSVSYPGFPEYYRQYAPAGLGHFGRFPFLGAAPEHGIVQIWTGLLIKTQPNWAVLVRQPVNLPRRTDVEVLDGIIETDWWFGPIVAPVRLCKTDKPIEFNTRQPLYHIQPIPKVIYTEKLLNQVAIVCDLADFTEQEWAESAAALLLRNNPNAPVGSYKIAARQRRGRGQSQTGDGRERSEGDGACHEQAAIGVTQES